MLALFDQYWWAVVGLALAALLAIIVVTRRCAPTPSRGFAAPPDPGAVGELDEVRKVQAGIEQLVHVPRWYPAALAAMFGGLTASWNLAAYWWLEIVMVLGILVAAMGLLQVRESAGFRALGAWARSQVRLLVCTALPIALLWVAGAALVRHTGWQAWWYVDGAAVAVVSWWTLTRWSGVWARDVARRPDVGAAADRAAICDQVLAGGGMVPLCAALYPMRAMEARRLRLQVGLAARPLTELLIRLGDAEYVTQMRVRSRGRDHLWVSMTGAGRVAFAAHVSYLRRAG